MSLIVLTLGIGVNITIFTAVKTVLLDPLPYKNPSRLVALYEWGVVHDSAGPISPPDFYDWQRYSKSFESMAAYGQSGATLSGSATKLPEYVAGMLCTWNLFKTLGIEPAVGRTFSAADDTPKAARTIILSYALWQRRFSGDRRIVGKTISLDSGLYTLIGILPSHFEFWYPAAQYWVPLQTQLSPRELNQRGAHRLFAAARLKPGVSLREANTDLSEIQARYKHQHPDAFVGRRAQIYTLWSQIVHKSVEKSLYILWAAVGCVLLIACVNLANLLLSRSAGRRREMTIRMALGATRWRIGRLLLQESLILSCAGGLAAVLLASWLAGLLVKIGAFLPRASEIQMDWSTVAFAAGLAILSGLTAGLLPGVTAARIDLNRPMHEWGHTLAGSQGKQRSRNMLVAAEIALSFLLLTGAGLLLKSFVLLRTVDTGFNPDHVLTMSIDLPDRYNTNAKITRFYEELLQHVEALPGVRSAGLVSVLPIAGHVMDTGFTIAGAPPLPPGKFQNALVRLAGPQYFGTMGIPLLQGRSFLPSERLERANAAIISESFAHRYFPHQNPIGRHIIFFGDKPREIVGVVGDVRKNIAESPEPIMYGPAFSGDLSSLSLVIRTKSDPLSLALPVEKQLATMDRSLAVSGVLTMRQLISEHTASRQLNLMLLSCFAGLAVFLAAVGLYGVVSYAASQRTQEFGIRLALGATTADLVRSVLIQALQPAIAGLAAGLVSALLLARVMESLLFEVKPLDPSVFLAVACVLFAVSILACLVPALRTAKIDPVQALRIE